MQPQEGSISVHAYRPKGILTGLFVCYKAACFLIKKSVLLSLIAISIITLCVSTAVGIYAAYFQDKVIPNTTLAAIPVSTYTRSDLSTLIDQSITPSLQKPVTLQSDKKIWQFTPDELGIQIDREKTIDETFEAFHTGSLTKKWNDALIHTVGQYNKDIQFRIDTDKLHSALYGITKDIEQEPKNASVKIQGGKIETVPEENGIKVSTAELEKRILDSIKNLKNTNLIAPTVTVSPTVTKEDVENVLPEIQLVVATPVELKHEQNTYTVDNGKIASWLWLHESRDIGVENPAVEIRLKETEVVAYLEKEIAPQVNQASEPKEIITSVEKTATIHEGKEGKKLDILKTLELFKEQLSQAGERKMELPMVTVTPQENLADIPSAEEEAGKYIIVSLKRQMAFAYEGKKLIFFTKVSTGIPSHPTMTGKFKVYSKTAKQKMSGPGYYLPNVPWILWYHGDYSLHGTYWHNNFGHPMSHGCTNLSIDDAHWFYDWAEVGTPVINVN